jgi:hypothetical protein
MNKYKVWETLTSIDDAIDIEAENPGQAAFFAANIQKPKESTEFVVVLEDVHSFVVIEPETWYRVSRVRTVELTEDAPALA